MSLLSETLSDRRDEAIHCFGATTNNYFHYKTCIVFGVKVINLVTILTKSKTMEHSLQEMFTVKCS